MIDISVKNLKNMQSNGKNFKIYNHVNCFLVRVIDIGYKQTFPLFYSILNKMYFEWPQ